VQISPWPNIYLPPVDIQLPPLRISTSAGERVFGAKETLMYVCGITPYDSTHLGHAATYLTFDLIHRYINCSGGNTVFVENITDIDEPLLQRASRDNVDWKQLALDQVQLFQSDMSALHILPPVFFVPATSAMGLVDEAIVRMNENGYVYKVDEDLYFDCSKFLDKLPISQEQALVIFAERGGDPDRIGKRHPLDPVLWIANRDDQPGWESSHGFGRPGWHVECCVISLHYLLGPDYLEKAGVSTLIDIQGGGSDLIFPHHFMSAAQAEAMTGIEFAKAYVHTGMVGLEGEKMSKSKGNLVFVSQLVADGIDPMVIRYALLQAKYFEDRMWDQSVLASATNAVSRIRLNLSKSEVAPSAPLLEAITNALSSNLDTPAALLAINRWCEASEREPRVDEAGTVSRALDSLLGLAL
jgi:L-cysteine:1D-myo-inositol 2-amino-2-deoxy-alpha-D-glucopyranoside ligase